jgi:hypothetical protein
MREGERREPPPSLSPARFDLPLARLNPRPYPSALGFVTPRRPPTFASSIRASNLRSLIWPQLPLLWLLANGSQHKYAFCLPPLPFLCSMLLSAPSFAWIVELECIFWFVAGLLLCARLLTGCAWLFSTLQPTRQQHNGESS